MLNAEIIQYKTNISEEYIKDFFNLKENSFLDLNKLTEILIFLEIKISTFLNFILSQGTIQTNVSSIISKEFIEKNQNILFFGPFQNKFEQRDKILTYEAGNKSMNSDLMLIVLLITSDFFEKGKGFTNELKTILNNLHLNSNLLKYNFQITNYQNPIISDKDLSLYFTSEIYKKHKNILKLIRDGVEIFYQNHLLSSFYTKANVEITVFNNRENPEILIEKLIKHGAIPGPLIKIMNMKIEKNKTIIEFKIGQFEIGKNIETKHNFELKLILKNLILEIFYHRSIKTLENLRRNI